MNHIVSFLLWFIKAISVGVHYALIKPRKIKWENSMGKFVLIASYSISDKFKENVKIQNIM